MIDHVRYPIGHFVPINNPSIVERNNFINIIPEITTALRGILINVKLDQLNIPYRVDGWSIQQIIHHMADNDMNAYLRFKRALTEDEPSAESYREELWAELQDYSDTHIETSITLLESLHSRFYILLQSLTSEHFTRTLKTQVLGIVSLDIALQRFVWHNQHHMMQIKRHLSNIGM